MAKNAMILGLARWPGPLQRLAGQGSVSAWPGPLGGHVVPPRAKRRHTLPHQALRWACDHPLSPFIPLMAGVLERPRRPTPIPHARHGRATASGRTTILLHCAGRWTSALTAMPCDGSDELHLTKGKPPWTTTMRDSGRPYESVFHRVFVTLMRSRGGPFWRDDSRRSRGPRSRAASWPTSKAREPRRRSPRTPR